MPGGVCRPALRRHPPAARVVCGARCRLRRRRGGSLQHARPGQPDGAACRGRRGLPGVVVMNTMRKRLLPAATFCYVWLMVGFFTGTLVLVGPAGWLANALRARGWPQR